MAKQWILVAHQAGARLFERHNKRDIALVEDIPHPEGRLRNRDIDSDRSGGSASEPQNFGTHMTPPHEDAHAHKAALFAKQLVDKLAKAGSEQRYEQLVLIADPKFLGRLRGCLDPQTSKRLIAAHEKDYAWVPEHELNRRLETLLEFT